MTDYDVTKRPDGDWQATTPGAKRASAVEGTQKEAQKKATEFARNSGGGEVRVHGEDGRIRNPNTIGKRDPNPPKDRKH